MATKQVFISVDVETAGPIPCEYSMFTLGACRVEDPSRTFSCMIKPINDRFVPEALEVTGLSMEIASQGRAGSQCRDAELR
jgi:ribonuclease T